MKLKTEIYSPLSGYVKDLNEVNDEMFSKRMIGDGVAIIPTEKELKSPVTGKIKFIYETRHAIGIETQEGIEILIHMGIDTVMLNGEPFETKVCTGDDVVVGDILMVVDWNMMKQAGYDTITPILVLNESIKEANIHKNIIVGETLMLV